MLRSILFLALTTMIAPHSAAALIAARPIEIHQVLAGPANSAQEVALTLDACGGSFDADLVNFLVAHRIPATIFATRKWIDRNASGLAQLVAHPDLFEIEDHGANHVPAVVGNGRRVYGIAGNPDLEHLTREVVDGAAAVARASGREPRWYRGATAEYDPVAIEAIRLLGYRIAGFSVNADAGATLSRKQIIARLAAVRNGDIIIAHMNKPASDTAEGLSEGLEKLQARGFRFVRLGTTEVREIH
jgi:peptidoglycan/xylan/chitin deacetylase (PgdA/CDA1 family)